MAKHTITYNQLFAIDQDLMRLQHGSPALMLLLLHKDINNYLKKAQLELKILYKNMKEIQVKYILQNEDESFQTYSVNGEEKFRFKPTVTNIKQAKILSGSEVEAAYLQEMNEYLNRSCTIEL